MVSNAQPNASLSETVYEPALRFNNGLEVDPVDHERLKGAFPVGLTVMLPFVPPLHVGVVTKPLKRGGAVRAIKAVSVSVLPAASVTVNEIIWDEAGQTVSVGFEEPLDQA